MKETYCYLNTTSYGIYILNVLSCQRYVDFSVLKIVNDKDKVLSKLKHIRLSAIKRGLECTLTEKDVEKLLSVKRCYYTGIRFTDDKPRSFDRVDNSKGYIPGNVVTCIEQVNQLKANYLEILTTSKKRIALTPKQLLRMSNLLVKRLST